MELEKTVTAFHRICSVVGISIFAKENYFSKPWLILQTLTFILAIFACVFITAFMAANYTNLSLFIQGAVVWTTGAIMTISLGVCLFFRVKFRKFLEEMVFVDRILEMPLVDYALKVESQKLSTLTKLRNKVEDSHRDLLKYTRILLKGYAGYVTVTTTLYVCSPIVVMIMNKNANLRLLAFDMLFPWTLQNFYVYIVSFIYHAYCGYLCCIAYPALQCLITLLIGQVIRQLRILTFIFMNLNELAVEISGKNKDRWQITSTSILTQCIDHYATLKRFNNEINYICRPFYLTVILVATMFICMCSVKISVSPKLSLDTMKYTIHEVSYIIVVLMFCLLGQQVENECELLEVAVTEKWYIFDKKHKKIVLLFNMAVAQRMPIYIFGTVTLSLQTFSWFIRTGMSFFTLVMTVLEEEQ